jgi:hypothetical protein
MTDFIPYFAGLITILFAVAFLLALKEMKKIQRDDKNQGNTKV